MSEKKNKQKLEVMEGKKDNAIIEAENVIDVAEELDKWREIEHMKFKHMIHQVQRIDTFAQIKMNAKDFLSEVPTFEEVIEWMNDGVATFEKADELLDNITVDDLIGDEFVDPYKELLVFPKDCRNYKDAFRALLIYEWILPFGANLAKLYTTIHKELGDDVLDIDNGEQR